MSTITHLRKICLALAGSEEVETWGHPTFRVGGKMFCVFEEYKGVPSIVVKVGKPALGIFLEDPRFYQAPYIGKNGWVSLRAEGNLNWEEVGELVKGSYGLVAPPGLSLRDGESKSSTHKRKRPARSGAAIKRANTGR